MAALLSKFSKPEGTMTRISAIDCREQASLGDNSGTDSFDQIGSLSFEIFDVSVIVTVKVN